MIFHDLLTILMVFFHCYERLPRVYQYSINIPVRFHESSININIPWQFHQYLRILFISLFQQYSTSISSLLHHYDYQWFTITHNFFPVKTHENPAESLCNLSFLKAKWPSRPPHRRPRVRALDCEMVGVGPRGKRSVLIRVSVVSRHGKAGDGGWKCLTRGI